MAAIGAAKLNKKRAVRLAKEIGIPRSTFYCSQKHNKQSKKDKASLKKLTRLHLQRPNYGINRLSQALSWSTTKPKRIKQLSAITIARSKTSYKCKHRSASPKEAPDNLMTPYRTYKDPNKHYKGYYFQKEDLNQISIWAADFFHIKHQQTEYHLAIIVDISSRFIINWNLGLHHNSSLIDNTLAQALRLYPKPDIHHSDRGTEYLSKSQQQILSNHQIKQSCSKARSPWENGFCERLIRTIREEAGDLNRLQNLRQLEEYIGSIIYDYNHHRYHTALKTTPFKYYRNLHQKNTRLV